MGFCSVNVRRGFLGQGSVMHGFAAVLRVSAGAVFHGCTSISSVPVRNISNGIAPADADPTVSKPAARMFFLQKIVGSAEQICFVGKMSNVCPLPTLSSQSLSQKKTETRNLKSFLQPCPLKLRIT
jgi:hypothetical protein